MNIVADTNIFLAVALEEKNKERIIEITTGCDIYAPEILPYEIGNALSAMVKRRQIPKDEVVTILNITQEIPVSLARVDLSKALRIAAQYKIYAYDAYFLQCSLSLSSPLITLDSDLKIVAKAMNIQILE